MDESEVIRELSHRTGLPESAAEAVLHGLRDLVHDGAVDGDILTTPAFANVVMDAAHPVPPAAEKIPIASPEDPRLVDELIRRARKHPLGLEFLLSGFLASVAIALGAHAFTVEAARARLRKEQKEQQPGKKESESA